MQATGTSGGEIRPPAVPATGDSTEHYTGVSARGANDVWIVEAGANGPTSYHSTGAALTPVPVPVGAGNLVSVITTGGGKAWAAGTALIHWDGTRWTPVASPATGALAARGPYDVWAANATTILHWPDLPTFADVPVGHPFYRYVQVLACRNVVNGYGCGGPGEPCDPLQRPYFRGGNLLTRGQAARIVALAANASGTPSGYTFADVPPSHPFYRWVEIMAGQSIVSGYACGGPGEPCDAQSRPYFRPSASVTRGQLAKIVALAANLAGTPTTQTFADVPVAHPFYRWVEQIAALGIISGYTCGGPGEPCDAQNRPYFRPYSTATRGQTAKTVANTFYPGSGPVFRP